MSYLIGDVAKATGMTPDLIRKWERRHGWPRPPSILGRLGRQGLVPRLPAWLIPTNQTTTPSRADRMDAQPKETEDAFA